MREDEKKQIGQRLISALHSLGLDSKARIKETTGLSDHALWRYGEGKRAPSLSQLELLAQTVPELDLHWIITGQKAPRRLGGFDMPTLQPDGTYINEPDWGEAWLEEHKLNLENLAGWLLGESSWEPIVRPGDHIIFDRGKTDLSQAGPFILQLEKNSPIMRKVEPAGKGMFLLSSATPNIITMNEADLRVLGRVVAVLHQKA